MTNLEEYFEMQDALELLEHEDNVPAVVCSTCNAGPDEDHHEECGE